MCRSMEDIHSATAEIRRGKKELRKIDRKKKKKPQGKNMMSAYAMQGGINKLAAFLWPTVYNNNNNNKH